MAIRVPREAKSDLNSTGHRTSGQLNRRRGPSFGLKGPHVDLGGPYVDLGSPGVLFIDLRGTFVGLRHALCRPERRALVGLRGPFADLKGLSFGLRNSCVGLKDHREGGLKGPSYGLPSRWGPFRSGTAICRWGRACAALRGPSLYGQRSKCAHFRPKRAICR